MRIRSASGPELELRELGGSGPPVLFVHGLGLNGAVWEPVADALPSRSSFALDLRGHGASRVEPGHAFSWDGFALDVLVAASAVRRLNDEAPVGVGHSGGAAALELAAARAAGAFSALVLYEPPRSLGASGERVDVMAAGARRRRDWFPSLDAAEATLAVREPLSAFHPAARRAYVRAGFGPGPQDTVQLLCRPDDEARIYELGFPPAAAPPACPVLLLCGELSEPWRRLLGAEAFPARGHYGPLEAPAAFAARVERFLTPPA